MARRTKRPLSDGEIALVRAAFGDAVDYRRVRLVGGPGLHPFAHLAFLLGNPAITLGATIYFRGNLPADFSAPGCDRRMFVHEMTHVWQYRALGIAPFLLLYMWEFVKAGGWAGRMYRYEVGREPFRAARLEAQAEMAADFGEALRRGDDAEARLLAANLAGSGLYGL